jgi:predicted MPP superfamily phosphohydrolase
MTTVTGLLVLAHCYIFWRLRAAFGGGWWQIPALLLFAAMIGLVLLSRRPLWTDLPEPLFKLGYLWLGCVMVSLSAFLCVDLLRLFLFVAAKVTGGPFLLTAGRAGILALALSCGLSLYAYWRAMTPVPVFLSLASDKIAAGSAPLRVAAVSDIHLSRFVGPDRLERITRTIAEQSPDILVLLGDIVDMDMRGKEREAALLRGVAPREGAFAVLGNHEAYRGVGQAVDFLRRSGYTVLRNESVPVRGITIAGVDDPALGSGIPGEKALLQSLDRSRFILFLRHRPGGAAGLAGLHDLQLSGHTHGGQIWPGRLIVGRVHGVRQGLSRVRGTAGESLLYVLNGAGFWGPPMRFGATPEILVIDIIPARG